MQRLNRGQAMAEFVVMTAGCVLLLFVLVPVVAKMTDMAYKAQEAARYTAWERTVWYAPNGGDETTPRQIDTGSGYLAIRSDEEILNSAEQRLLAFQSTPANFAPQDIAPADSTLNNRFWRWTHGQGAAMLGSNQMPGNSGLTNRKPESLAYSIIDTYNDAMGGIVKVVNIFSFGGGDDDFLQIAHPTHTLYSAQIDMPVSLAGSNLGTQSLFPEQLGALNVRARSAVLADGWVAQSEGHFDEKVDDFVLGTLIEDNRIWQTVRSIIGIFEPSFKDIDFSPVNTEPMPDTDFTCNEFTGFCYFNE